MTCFALKRSRSSCTPGRGRVPPRSISTSRLRFDAEQEPAQRLEPMPWSNRYADVPRRALSQDQARASNRRTERSSRNRILKSARAGSARSACRLKRS